MCVFKNKNEQVEDLVCVYEDQTIYDVLDVRLKAVEGNIDDNLVDYILIDEKVAMNFMIEAILDKEYPEERSKTKTLYDLMGIK